MPLSEALGTKVDRISGESMKKSTPPPRSWLRTSVSAPSWLCGKTVISILPSLSSLIRSFASSTRTFDGCVSGWLLASLRLYSAALRRAHPDERCGEGSGCGAEHQRAAGEVHMVYPPWTWCMLVLPGQRKKVEKCGTAAMIRSPAISAAI